jgi:SAM-dependent methyltransferase
MSLATKGVGAARRVEQRFAPHASYRHHYTCPICGYVGPFASDIALTGRRPNAQCPKCWCSERHRTQALVMNKLAERYDFSSLSMLHIAPESFLRDRFRKEFGRYVTANLTTEFGDDIAVDLTDTDLPDESFDVVYASHVFEHIPDDRAAAETVHRLLTPNGFAVLPVPIVGDTTVEYPHPVATEHLHVRAPGPDYIDRFADLFDIERFTSEDLDDTYQVWVYENRTRYPTKWAPYRIPSTGTRHVDIVPVFTKKK